MSNSQDQPTALPRWKCHKEVTAARIKAISDFGELARLIVDLGANVDGYVHVSAEYMNKHKPMPGGYFVRYADGYESYSPPEAFESGYTRISADWRDRIKEEQRELDVKIKRLKEFLASAPTLARIGVPSVQISLLRTQLSYMNIYSEVLTERLQNP